MAEQLTNRERRQLARKEFFKTLLIPLCAVVILVCLKDMSLSYVFAERAVENRLHSYNLSSFDFPHFFRISSQNMSEAIVNVNGMWVGIHALGIYAVVVEDTCVLYAFSALETGADILFVMYWSGGFFPLVLPDMCILTVYFFLITLFSWGLTLSLI